MKKQASSSFIEDELDHASSAAAAAANPNFHQRQSGDYFFKFQFFIHECQLLKDFYNVHKPAVALRFLDFPTLIMEGQLNQTTGRLRFTQGKKCNFKMNSDDMQRAIISKPFFVMFIDASTNK